MKLQKFILAMVVIFITATSCKKNVIEPEPDTPTKPKVELKNPINDFTWKAMNSWYNWQDKVPNLADSKANNVDSYRTYLNKYSTPKNLFSSLLYNYGSTDRFSWFIPDYVKQQQSFQGISTSFGIKYAIKDGYIAAISPDESKQNIIIYVVYVSKNSPADKAGIKRGDIIGGLNGSLFTNSNIGTVWENFSNETVKFMLMKKDGLTLKDEITVTKAVVADDPVHFVKVFDNIGGKKVGYLVYNSFRSTYNDELNDAFAEFKNAGIQELILDLRYNGGGSVATSAYLASMIYQGATGTFAELRFNKKQTNQNRTYSFDNTLNVYDYDNSQNKVVKTGTQSINRINGLTKLYVLTSKRTASASEMIINGLKPYMTVKTIGQATYGKNVGSITLYDLPENDYLDPHYLEKSAKKTRLINKLKNKPHKNAMQPIVFQIYNKNGENDYTHGFNPDIETEIEHNYWNNILPFGNENEVFLKVALNDIKGVSARPYRTNRNFETIKLDVSRPQFENEMYIESDFFNN